MRFLLIFLTVSHVTFSQSLDSIKTVKLSEIKIWDKNNSIAGGRLKEIESTNIFSGKKTEVIHVEALNADLSTNNSRQIFARVPGISVWENDGSGIQTSIATRGLSPNRSWEFNVRQNGYDISSEVFGYPEAYFAPPSEALSRIELVRGAASLQNGPQFGGLLNYIVKDHIGTKPFSFESHQTAGSYGLFNSFNAIGGISKKVKYYAYHHQRSADGWRENSQYRTNTSYASIQYAINKHVRIGIEYTHMDYVSQQAGGLSDDQFEKNPQQSLRSRNWFSTPWNLLALTSEIDFSEQTKLTAKVFATLGERNSVGFVRPITVADTFNINSNSFNPRQVDKDYYANIGSEVRFLHSYKFLNQQNAFSAGARIYQGQTDRFQLGNGTTQNDFDLTIATKQNGKNWGRDLDYITTNYAFFIENLFAIGKHLQVIPSMRYELLQQQASGYITNSPQGIIPEKSSTRSFLLMGLGSEYHLGKNTELYANISQSFRPVTFSEFTPSSTIEVVDPNLSNAKGYNLDVGYRGTIKKYLSFDVSIFQLVYENRVGVLTINNAPFKTNIGTSRSRGVELFAELQPLQLLKVSPAFGSINIFSSFAYTDARYITWNNPDIKNDPLKSIEGKRVENAPRTITRVGVSYTIKKISASLLINSISDVFTDAANTKAPNDIATVGILKGYSLTDITFTYFIIPNLSLRGGINNLNNEQYATRRAGGYPGPGILPGTGKTFFIGLSASL